MASIQTVVTVDDREAFIALYSYLKGEIIGYSVANGMSYPEEKLVKYREDNENFNKGFKEGESHRSDREWITTRHIIYNRLRNTKPHTGNISSDRQFIIDTSTGNRRYYRNMAEKAEKDLSGFAEEIDISELVRA